LIDSIRCSLLIWTMKISLFLHLIKFLLEQIILPLLFLHPLVKSLEIIMQYVILWSKLLILSN
jgi:hypothetical protein